MNLLILLNCIILAGVIFVAVTLWRIPKKCPKCGKRMTIASIQLICKKCGAVESDFRE